MKEQEEKVSPITHNPEFFLPTEEVNWDMYDFCLF